jgi:hypothetical protein
MQSQDEQFIPAFVNDLSREVEKAARNPTCLYPGCSKRPIGSHMIARSTLQLIAENSHVLAWFIPDWWKMVRVLRAGRSLEQLSKEPVSVGIRNKQKVTYPLFCEEHDSKIFAPLETEAFAFRPEQVLLLAYRASCYLTFPVASLTEAIFAVARHYQYAHSPDTPERRQNLERLLAGQCIRDAQQRYTSIYQSKDYHQLQWVTNLVDIPVCLAATYALIPIADENDAQAIVNGTQVLTAEDVVSFSLLPFPRQKNSLCVISWFKGSRRAEQFKAVTGLSELSPKERENFSLHYAFESPTLYLSPVWWRSLSEELRERYRQIHLRTGRDDAELVELF